MSLSETVEKEIIKKEKEYNALLNNARYFPSKLWIAQKCLKELLDLKGISIFHLHPRIKRKN